jgi:hypothetical protein
MISKLIWGLVGLIVIAAFLIGNVQAGNGTYMEMGSALSITGEGVIDVGLNVGAALGVYNGMTLEREIYTPGLGYHGISKISYKSEFALGRHGRAAMNSSEEELPPDFLEYASVCDATYVKDNFAAKNYDLGSYFGFTSSTNKANKEVRYYTGGNLAEVDIELELDGSIKFVQKMTNPVTFETELLNVNELQGVFNASWAAYGERSEYPSAGEGDWLGCP